MPITIIGTGKLKFQRRTMVVRDPGTGEVIVGVDTLRATAADLEVAMQAAANLSRTPTGVSATGPTGSIVGPPPFEARSRAPQDPVLKSYMQRLRTSPVRKAYFIGLGREVKVWVGPGGK